MIRFRQKEFGKLKSTLEYVKKYPTLPLSAATLGITSSNFIMNNKRYKRDKEFREHQTKIMNSLTDSMNKASNSMDRMSASIDNFDSRIKPVIDRQNRLIAAQKSNQKPKKRSGFSIFRMFRGGDNG